MYVPRAAIAVALLLGSGCTPAGPAPSPSPSASPAPAPSALPAPIVTAVPAPDLRRLLISPSDIPLAGYVPPTVRPLDENAVEGVTALYETADGGSQMIMTIVLLPDAAAAATAVSGAATTAREQRPGTISAPVAAGDTAVAVSGDGPDGTASILLLFSQGTASVAMDFLSPGADPIPPEAALQAAVRQAALLRTAYG